MDFQSKIWIKIELTETAQPPQAAPPAPPRVGKEAGGRIVHLLLRPFLSVLSNGEVRLYIYPAVRERELAANGHLFWGRFRRGNRGEISWSRCSEGGEADFSNLQRIRSPGTL